jgi:hypothetical protein
LNYIMKLNKIKLLYKIVLKYKNCFFKMNAHEP